MTPELVGAKEFGMCTKQVSVDVLVLGVVSVVGYSFEVQLCRDSGVSKQSNHVSKLCVPTYGICFRVF